MFGRDRAKSDGAVLPPGANPQDGQEPPAESILAPNLSFKGNFSFQGALRIEGEVQGNITGEGRVTVGPGGKVVGDIMAAEVVVQGRVQGKVTAVGRLELSGTAWMVGDFTCTHLVVSEGAKLLGRHEVDSESLSLPSSNGGGSQQAASGKHGAPGASAVRTDDALEKVFQ